jgi:uncharacterized protein YjiS (DUF1127 family)
MSHSSNADRGLPVHLGPSGSWIAVVSKLLERLVRGLTTRESTAELGAMGDRHLADIGLTRQQVEYIARHGRWPAVKQYDL